MTSLFPRAVARLVADPRPDPALVAHFLRDADQQAFAEIVRRHGPLVLGVCRRTLGHAADADDAFQATFLVLVRRARHTAWRGSLGPWLYGVAVRVARKARAARARRAAVERGAAMTAEPAALPPEPDDAAAVLDDELAALPEAVRLPLVLCELQGLSRKDAARQLDLPEGTVSSRLARGRKLLRDRLARRGVAPLAGGLCVAVPAELARATAGRAGAILTGAAGAVPAGILALTDGVVKTMAVSTWKPAAVLVAAAVGLTGFGAWQGDAGPGLGVGAATAAEPDRPAGYTVHIREATAPERVVRVPATGNDTVFDLVTGLKDRGDLAPGDPSGADLWLVRLVQGGKPRRLPIDWAGLTERGQTATNYQLFPGDRLFVQSRPEAANPQVVVPPLGPLPVGLDFAFPVATPPFTFHLGFVDSGTVEKKPPPAADRPVATIFGSVDVSRAEFAEHLIRRYGNKELEPFVNKQIIRDALGRQGSTVRGDEVTAALDADARAAGLTREQFVKDILPRQGKTEDEWVEDVVIPRLMLGKLLGKRVEPPAEAEVRAAFDRKYGPKVACVMVRWPADSGSTAEGRERIAAQFRAADGWAQAVRVYRDVSKSGVRTWGGSEYYTFWRAGYDADNPAQRVGAKLKPGETSEVFQADGGFMVLKALEDLPADDTKTFAGERAALTEEVARGKLERELPKLFAELKRQAKPEYHLNRPAAP